MPRRALALVLLAALVPNASTAQEAPANWLTLRPVSPVHGAPTPALTYAIEASRITWTPATRTLFFRVAVGNERLDELEVRIEGASQGTTHTARSGVSLRYRRRNRLYWIASEPASVHFDLLDSSRAEGSYEFSYTSGDADRSTFLLSGRFRVSLSRGTATPNQD